MVLLSFLPLGVLISVRHPRPEGACVGIGWGCSFYGWQVALIYAVILGLPFVTALAVAISLADRLSRPLALGVSGAGLAILWLVVIGVPHPVINFG